MRILRSSSFKPRSSAINVPTYNGGVLSFEAYAGCACIFANTGPKYCAKPLETASTKGCIAALSSSGIIASALLPSDILATCSLLKIPPVACPLSVLLIAEPAELNALEAALAALLSTLDIFEAMLDAQELSFEVALDINVPIFVIAFEQPCCTRAAKLDAQLEAIDIARADQLDILLIVCDAQLENLDMLLDAKFVILAIP